MASVELPPLALYVHFPWCVRKCPYCDFNSFALGAELPEDAYVRALQADLALQAEAAQGRRIASVFMGGGTPSLFSPEAIGRVLESACAVVPFADDVEVTLEANPGTIERGRFAGYRAAGVTRVSLGAQSFDAQQLAALGRIHSPDETRRAAEELHAAGLENFNLDLMYALPGQDVAGAVADVDAALALAPAHLSHYQLTLEPGTVFAASPPPLPGDETSDAILGACQARLAAAGFRQYEVSGYARPGRECRHNLNYWTFGDYIGVGAGAHGKLTRADPWRIERTQQPREPRRYLAAYGAAYGVRAPGLARSDLARHGLVPTHGFAAPGYGPKRTVVPAVDLPFEFAMNALRLVRGFAEHEFTARTGLPLVAIAPQLQGLAARGLVERRGEGAWRCTPVGFRFLNDVLMAFLPSPPPGT